MSKNVSVDGVNDQDLVAAASALPKIPNLRAEDPDRFAQAVRGLVESRAQAGWPGEVSNTGVAAFVMVSRPREFARRFSSEPITDPAATSDRLLGKILLLTRDGAGGQAFEMPCQPNELLDWLVDEGLGNAPLVIAYRATSKMSVRLDGVDGDICRNDAIRNHPPAATIHDLDEALKHFHLSHLVTPAFCVTGVWETGKASSYVPGPQPERSIQNGLAISLNSWFHGVIKAEIEDSTSMGRIDVRLLTAEKNQPLKYWAIIELKVVKSFKNPIKMNGLTPVHLSTNIDAIIKGLQQACAYMSNRKTKLGLLEVFDLRKDKSYELFSDNKVQAAIVNLKPSPNYEIRPLYGSANDARLAGVMGI